MLHTQLLVAAKIILPDIFDITIKVQNVRISNFVLRLHTLYFV